MKLRLDQIKRDHKLSPRIEDRTDPKVAEDYSKCLDQLPPIEVYKVVDMDKYLLVDGWHRYRAAEILEREEIEVVAHFGTFEQAREAALLANLKHGKPLTRKEKRYVITEFLKLHPERSNSWIAGDLGCSKNTVNDIRLELETGCQFDTLSVLIGKDGKEYPRTIAQPKKEEPEPVEDDTEPLDDEQEEEATGEPEQQIPIAPMLGIYELDKAHQVDCIEGLMGLPENSIDLVFADPPYNLGKKYGSQFKDKREEGEYLEWCVKWFWGVYRVLKPGGSFYVMHYPEVTASWKQQLDSLFAFRFQRWITWVYPSNIGHSGDNWRRSHRAVLYYVKGDTAAYFKGEADPQPYKNPDDIRVAHLGKKGTTPYDWWEWNLVKNVSKDKTGWPNQLPVVLVHRIVVTSCPEDGVVLDPFIGSGTTAEVAVKSGRSWIGFDIHSEACEITKERLVNVRRG